MRKITFGFVSKYFSPRLLEGFQFAQTVVMFAILGYAVEQLALDGLYARGILQIHWLYIAMFLAVLCAYFLFDRVNFLYVIPIGVAYYCIHEALFNAFFIPYNGFRNPCCAPTMWYHEMEAIAVVTPIFIAICVKYRERIVRSGQWKKIAFFLWLGLIELYAVRIMDGFPMTINVYGGSSPVALADEFEFATNVLFALTFYATFRFSKNMSRSKTTLEKLPVSNSLPIE